MVVLDFIESNVSQLKSMAKLNLKFLDCLYIKQSLVQRFDVSKLIFADSEFMLCVDEGLMQDKSVYVKMKHA